MSLKYRIAVTIVTLVAITLWLVLWQTLALVQEKSEQLLAENEKVILDLMEETTRNALANLDFDQLQQYLEHVGANPRVVQAMVVNHRNEIVASDTSTDIGLPHPLFVDREDKFWRTRILSDPSGKVGLLAIQFSNEGLTAITDEARNHGLTIAIIGIIPTAVIGLIIGFLLTHRLHELSDIVQKFASGDMEARTHFKGRDEVAIVGSTFDEMARQISKSIEVLEESKERFEFASQGASDGIWDWDVGTGDIYLSPRWKKLLGYEDHEIENKFTAWRDLIHSSDLGRVLNTWTEYMEGEIGEFRMEYRMLTKAGDYLPIECKGISVREESGAPLRLAGCITDISERKRAEQQIEQHVQKLEAMNKELQEFNYVASHDLQEPLRTIQSYAALLVEDLAGLTLSDDAREDLSFITDASTRMRYLVQDLLVLSRTGHSSEEYEPVDLDECMSTVVNNLKKSIEQTNAVVEWRDLPTVVGNSSQLLRVFQNLLSNAIKFHGESPPYIRVSAKPRPGEWEISVADNGIGIEAEYLEHIFLPFKRLHGIGDYGGSGIGLSIVRKIIELHDGEVSAISVPGKGTTFRLTLKAQSAS